MTDAEVLELAEEQYVEYVTTTERARRMMSPQERQAGALLFSYEGKDRYLCELRQRVLAENKRISELEAAKVLECH